MFSASRLIGSLSQKVSCYSQAITSSVRSFASAPHLQQQVPAAQGGRRPMMQDINSINQVILVGTVGRLEVAQMENGRHRCRINLMTMHRVTLRDGNFVTRRLAHRVEVSRQDYVDAITNGLVGRGDRLLIRGRLLYDLPNAPRSFGDEASRSEYKFAKVQALEMQNLSRPLEEETTLGSAKASEQSQEHPGQVVAPAGEQGAALEQSQGRRQPSRLQSVAQAQEAAADAPQAQAPAQEQFKQ